MKDGMPETRQEPGPVHEQDPRRRRPLKFSLVLATVGRVEEPDRFLRSLASQSYTNCELIVVDQNPDDRLVPLLSAYEGQLRLKHTRSPLGLSRARNAGLKFADGDIVAFPDDDCWYPADLLSRVARFFEKHPERDGLTGPPALPAGGPILKWEDEAGAVTKFNVWQRGMSLAMFLRRSVIAAVGNFDETLGVGSGTPWGSGEETDYLLSALERGFAVFYEPSIAVFHPHLLTGNYNRAERYKAYAYGRGTGRVLRIHNYSPSQAWKPFFFQPLRGAIALLLKGRPRQALYCWAMFRGRLVGYAPRLDGGGWHAAGTPRASGFRSSFSQPGEAESRQVGNPEV